MWPFEKKEDKKVVAFGDILTGMQNAISQVQDMLQNSQLRNLSNFWQSDGCPVSHTIKIGKKTVDIPLLTLVSHNQLAMDSVNVQFSTKVNSIVPKQSDDYLKAGNITGGADTALPSLDHADIQVAMDGVTANGEDIMHVSITFKIKDTPEAIARLMDEYNKDI